MTRSRWTTVPLAVASAAGMLLAPCGVIAASGTARTTASEPGRAVTLDGVWRTDGYGQYVQIRGRRLLTYDTTAASCLPAATGAARTLGPSRRFAVTDDDAVTITLTGVSTAREHIDSATSVRRLRRVAGLPSRCGRPAPGDPLSTFDVFWQTFAENYPFFALHHVDWWAARERFRPMIDRNTPPARLFAIMRRMLVPLHDEHVALFGPADERPVTGSRPGTAIPTPDLDAAARRELIHVDLPSVGAGPVALTSYADGRIETATLPGSVGYLRVSGFAGYTATDTETANSAELERVLDVVFARRHVRQWRGLMIDLRVNGGGSDALALQLAARLTGKPYLAYAKQYRHGGVTHVCWSTRQPSVVVPSAGPSFTGPVTVLTSGSTVSAGETFTMALAGRAPAAVRVGENTQGVFSDVLSRPLPNGWSFTLPNERYLDAGGASFDGVGVAPSVRESFVTAGPDPLFTTAYRITRR